eukprot:m.117731 g.117731  ORF g.117731 m.117731 type:complete len:109 (+) comp51978_c0_seq8:139-465(+)
MHALDVFFCFLEIGAETGRWLPAGTGWVCFPDDDVGLSSSGSCAYDFVYIVWTPSSLKLRGVEAGSVIGASTGGSAGRSLATWISSGTAGSDGSAAAVGKAGTSAMGG